MSSLTLEQEQPEAITVGHMKFTESQLKALYSGILRACKAAYDENNSLVFTTTEAAVFNVIVRDIGRTGLVNT